MAKKAPAKRDSFPAEFAQATAEIRKSASRPPAKRKPRVKKPVPIPPPPQNVPEDVLRAAIEDAEARQLARVDGIEIVKMPADVQTELLEIYKRRAAKKTVVPVIDPLDEGGSLVLRSWIVTTLKAALLIAVGIAAGIWIAGGISISPDNRPEPTPVVPEPVKSFRVIFVKESGQTLTGEQVAIPGAKEIRDYLTAKTTQEGGQVGWREYDPQQQTTNEQPTMKKLWETAKPSLLPAPCLIVEVNGKAIVMPFPKTVAEAVETLKKAGG